MYKLKLCFSLINSKNYFRLNLDMEIYYCNLFIPQIDKTHLEISSCSLLATNVCVYVHGCAILCFCRTI